MWYADLLELSLKVEWTVEVGDKGPNLASSLLFEGDIKDAGIGLSY
jgi:hypothetical protein